MLNRTVAMTQMLLALVLVALAWRGYPQSSSGDKKESKAAGASEEKVREINVKADRAKYNHKTSITTFTGHVTVTQVGEKFTMLADTVEYEEKSDTAKATGSLSFSDPDTTIVGNLITANFRDKKALITGSVKLTSHGKESSGKGSEKKEEDKSEPLKEQYKKKRTVMDCDQIEYLYSEGKAVATGNLKFTQEDKKGTAQTATYLEDEKQLILEGGASVVNEKGETLRCRKAIIYIDEDAIDAEGVEAVLIRKEEKKTKEKSSGAASKPAAESKAETKTETRTETKEAK